MRNGIYIFLRPQITQFYNRHYTISLEVSDDLDLIAELYTCGEITLIAYQHKEIHKVLILHFEKNSSFVLKYITQPKNYVFWIKALCKWINLTHPRHSQSGVRQNCSHLILDYYIKDTYKLYKSPPNVTVMRKIHFLRCESSDLLQQRVNLTYLPLTIVMRSSVTIKGPGVIGLVGAHPRLK